MSDSVRPHRQQPIRLPGPWDSPGKNAGVGCHFLLQCMKTKSESKVAQSCPTLSDPMDCSLPGSSVHGFSRQEHWSGVPCPSPVTQRTIQCDLLCLYALTQAYTHTYKYMQTHKSGQSSWNRKKKRSICRECHIGNEWVILLEDFTSYLRNLAFMLNEMGN